MMIPSLPLRVLTRDRSMSLEVLDCPLMFLGSGPGVEGAQVAPFARLRILFPRIQTVFAGFQFSDHGDWEMQMAYR